MTDVLEQARKHPAWCPNCYQRSRAGLDRCWKHDGWVNLPDDDGYIAELERVDDTLPAGPERNDLVVGEGDEL